MVQLYTRMYQVMTDLWALLCGTCIVYELISGQLASIPQSYILLHLFAWYIHFSMTIFTSNLDGGDRIIMHDLIWLVNQEIKLE